MHSWAEVEHDLVYKPESGSLSGDEYAILDELNGLVISGEIALELLQKAFQSRVQHQKGNFLNHYELASYLFEYAKKQGVTKEEYLLGDVDILYRLLDSAKLNSPDKLSPFIERITPEIEKRPFAQQIIDEIIFSNETLYKKFQKIRRDAEYRNPYLKTPDYQTAQLTAHSIGIFMTNWIDLEKLLRHIATSLYPKEPPFILLNPKRIAGMNLFDQASFFKYQNLRETRNRLVHGTLMPTPEALKDATSSVQQLVDSLHNHKDKKIQSIIRKKPR
jgi:hypothetical protein